MVERENVNYAARRKLKREKKFYKPTRVIGAKKKKSFWFSVINTQGKKIDIPSVDI